MPLPWRQFDIAAPHYDEWYETPMGSFVDGIERRAILELLDPRRGELILDVGSGTGRYARELAQRGVRCVGIEPSAAMLEAGLGQGDAGNPAYVRGVAEHLPARAAAFDAVVAVTTLEFVSDIDRALDEMARVVRPGGRVVVGVLPAESRWARRRKESGQAIWKAARFLRRREIEERLAKYGGVRSRLVVHVPPQFGKLPQPVPAFVDRALRLLAPSSGAFLAVRVDVRR